MEDWRFLPQHIFEQIVRDLSLIELKKLTTICKHFNLKVDSYWKVVLNSSSVNISILENSSRHYEHLNISSRVKLLKAQRILRILKERGKLKSLTISHQKLFNIIEILKDAGKDLNYVNIIFKENEKISTPCIKISSLNNVQTLRVSGASENLGLISSNFTSLKDIYYCVNGNSYEQSLELLGSLVNQTKSSLKTVEIQFPDGFKGGSLEFLENIENLHNLSILSNGDPIEPRPQLFEKSWNLFSLKLNLCSLTNKDLLNILHFKTLENVVIGFSQNSTFDPETIKKIWDLPNLKSLEYPKLELTNDFSIVNSVNKNVKRLTLENVRLCLDFCKMFHHRAPNLEYFKIKDKHYRELTRFDLIDKLQNLSSLRVLDLNLSFRFWDHTRYSFLEELNLGRSCNDIPIEWCNLEVPNLKTLKLNSCSSWNNSTLEKCLSSCGNIRNLQVKCFKKTCDKTIEILCQKLPYLKVLKFGYLTSWEQLLNLFRNKTPMSLTFVEMDFSKIDFFCLNEGMVEEISDILKSPIRLCNSDDSLHFGDSYTLLGDLIEIKLFVLPERATTFN
ncbi:hypothetical protein ACFFRR_003284 [Megaselia abdita]